MYVKRKQSASPALGPERELAVFCGIFPQIACILRGSGPESSDFLFFNQRRVLRLLFERLGKPCQSSCRQLGELGHTGTTFRVEEKGEVSWEQAGSAGFTCNVPDKPAGRARITRSRWRSGKERAARKSEFSSPCTSRLEVCLCAWGGAPAHSARLPPLAPTLQEGQAPEDPARRAAPHKVSASAVGTRGAPAGLGSLPSARQPAGHTGAPVRRVTRPPVALAAGAARCGEDLTEKRRKSREEEEGSGAGGQPLPASSEGDKGIRAPRSQSAALRAGRSRDLGSSKGPRKDRSSPGNLTVVP
ncbi:unnamed protein product [Rangifer tarandus platyrhynchus]|uniref:Uncharacterized protein n=2 Tax=Rangifer tarandus platyrhynchus TaxID=3082113 RepID=A0ABN9A3L6_RANTA|nr:unnamed protein product [Rangifer tarandus platyrhynchus]CAI9714340.1 unnamed protein product [Rangifer tarandus platyrhynchus]